MKKIEVRFLKDEDPCKKGKEIFMDEDLARDAVILLLERAVIRTKLSRMKTVCPKHI